MFGSYRSESDGGEAGQEMTLPAVLHFLQSGWASFERDRGMYGAALHLPPRIAAHSHSLVSGHFQHSYQFSFRISASREKPVGYREPCHLGAAAASIECPDPASVRRGNQRFTLGDTCRLWQLVTVDGAVLGRVATGGCACAQMKNT